MNAGDINHITAEVSVVIAGITAFLVLLNKMLKETFVLMGILKKAWSLGVLSELQRLKKV